MQEVTVCGAFKPKNKPIVPNLYSLHRCIFSFKLNRISVSLPALLPWHNSDGSNGNSSIQWDREGGRLELALRAILEQIQRFKEGFVRRSLDGRYIGS